METFAQKNESQNTAILAMLEASRKAAEAKLSHNEFLVLSVLCGCASLMDGEPNAALSRYEIAKMIGISWNRVQRALSSLTDKGLIGRRQEAKQSGVVATTVVSSAAYALWGMEGGIKLGGEWLPNEFGPLLVGEGEAFADAVASAWKEGRMLTAREESDFRGGNKRLLEIRFFISAKVEKVQSDAFEAIAAVEARHDAEAEGRYLVELRCGTTVEFDQEKLTRLSKGHKAMAVADLRFARDVVERIDQMVPGFINSTNVGSLAAEILYSRQQGFVWKHDYEGAMRVLTSLVKRGSWSQPRGMETCWYQAVGCAVSAVTNRVSGAASLN